MITEKNHKLLTSQLFVTDCTKKGLASMQMQLKNQEKMTDLPLVVGKRIIYNLIQCTSS
jgi:hypothetical protein